jgi:Domain of unknown function (DUF5666)
MKTGRMPSVIAMLTLILGSAIAHAHNGLEYVMGTVTAMTDSSITVDTVKHTSVTVVIDLATKFTKGDAQVSQKDLQVGDRVVIDAKESSDRKLVGVSVKLGSMASAQQVDTARRRAPYRCGAGFV